MKILKFSLLFLALSGLVMIQNSCDKDDDEVATCTDGIQNGDETGIDCGGPDCAPCLVGCMGEWQSSGANVAPLLVTLFNTDSIYANFKTDLTYVVRQFDTQGAMVELTGVYTQQESSVAGIWTIVVNQSSPSTLTSEGIFQVTGTTMKYEIAQTQPDIGAVPPTPTGGFGSTSGGLFGTTNVQTYERIE